MKSKPTRGRPREYDPEAALTAALGEFRRRGYTATSLDHLSDATKMARPSLYAAFGNKFEIYRRAVTRYSEQTAERRRHALFEEPSLQKGLEDYFAAIIDAYFSGDGEPLGCPVLSVISGEAAADPVIGAELAAAIGRSDSLLQRRMTIAAEAGEIAADADVRGLAAMLAALQHSLALRARAGTPRPELIAIARAHVALVLKAAGAGRS
ncbi:TetR family transcriptional regulator [Pleomorphomonas diazotrophica]|uniref:TetR family transcriptional regulator n=1 Tax=Pleomorphomonas diazotrophica TaxID=1166257 RepID=A0A1I4V261_9HYPH|nr:TetR/AcrR family transcriptional regulator [Pleomorphomonas diazotrophica]PKR88700.1 TetR family transcriptional regulator [Pleomorphomonas diazotrophica]SFM95309.1 DNA-binding transcriptional regulator, AcrR family [Pleomorphomonas diazotrophica]